MTQRRLTLLLVLFFVALALPTSILVYQAYGQLKWEAFYQHQQLARELTLRIDSGFRDLIEREEDRPISDYEFLNVTGSGTSAFLQRSPLSQFPLESDVPGLLGYFQVDASGRLRTPIVPEASAGGYGISSPELRQREQQEGRIRGILGENRLVGKSDAVAATLPVDDVRADDGLMEMADAPVSSVASSAAREASPSFSSESDSQASGNVAEEVVAGDRDSSAQAGFDNLSKRKVNAPAASSAPAEQVKDLKLEDSYQVAAEAEPEAARLSAKKQTESKRSRKEKVNLPQALAMPKISLQKSLVEDEEEAMAEPLMQQQVIRIETFESEVEPMEFELLDSGHFVLFRRVWHQDERYVQGILIEQSEFIDALIAPAFRESSLSSMSKLIVAHRGAILQNFAADYSRLYRPSAEQEASELLYQSHLITPFSDIERVIRSILSLQSTQSSACTRS